MHKHRHKHKFHVFLAFIFFLMFVTALLYENGLFFPSHRYSKPEDHQIKVACVGYSITYGMKLKNWDKNAYPFVLRDLLGPSFCVENFGFSGRTVQKSADKPYTREKLYSQSLAFEPDIVILQIGTNDSKTFNWIDTDSFRKEYEELLDSYLNLPSKPKVILCAPPPAFKTPVLLKTSIQASVIENEICPAVKEIAKERKLQLIDLFEVFDGKSELFTDGLHPNEKGAKLYAQTVFEALTKPQETVTSPILPLNP